MHPKETKQTATKSCFHPTPFLWVSLGTLSFIFIDGILLSALPRLGLSFGTVYPAILWPMFGRFVVLFVAFLPLLRLCLSRRVVTPQNLRAALIILLALNMAETVVEIDALYIEPFTVAVTELHLAGPSFSEGRPLRIVQLSDLHMEGITPRERQMIEKVDALAPDLILLTGDYVHLDFLSSAQNRRDARTVLSQLHAPLGVYAVQGTVDSESVLAEIFSGTGITLLRNDVHPILLPQGELYLVGLDVATGIHHPEILPRLLSAAPADAYTILLYHTPDLIREATDAGVDLYLAGHTHGGQVRIPWYGALVTFSKYGKQYEAGKYIVDSTTLYVSRGLGMEGYGLPRARLFCLPEIVVIDLQPSEP